MIIYCVRHSHAEHNVENLMNGDPSKLFNLTELGKKQSKQIAEKIKDVSFDIIITSEFPRTIETAKIIINNPSIPFKKDERINDLKSVVEGENYEKYIEELKKAIEIQRVDIFNAKINDGESINEEKQRIHSFLDDLKNKEYQTVLIVAHYDTLQIIHGYVKNLANEQMKELIIEHGKVYKFEI